MLNRHRQHNGQHVVAIALCYQVLKLTNRPALLPTRNPFTNVRAIVEPHHMPTAIVWIESFHLPVEAPISRRSDGLGISMQLRLAPRLELIEFQLDRDGIGLPQQVRYIYTAL